VAHVRSSIGEEGYQVRMVVRPSAALTREWAGRAAGRERRAPRRAGTIGKSAHHIGILETHGDEGRPDMSNPQVLKTVGGSSQAELRAGCRERSRGRPPGPARDLAGDDDARSASLALKVSFDGGTSAR